MGKPSAPASDSPIRRISHSTAVVARELAATASSSAYLILAAGALLGIMGSLRYARDSFDMGEYGLAGWILAATAGAVAIASTLCAMWLLKRKQALDAKWFIAGLVAASLLLRFILLQFVDSQWGTDYLRYWEYAQNLVETERFGGFNAPYYARSLFFPYPIIRIFGPEATHLLKLVNTLLLVIMQVLAYDILRRLRNHQAAQAASVLLLAAPIPAYMALIPSHDLWGTFFLAVVAWLVTVAIRPKAYPALAIAVAIAAGVVAYLAEVQRGLGLVFCVALGIAAVLFALGQYRRPGGEQAATRSPFLVLLVAALCFAAYMGSARLDTRIGLKSDARPVYSNMKFSANASGMGTGRSDWFARFRDRFVEKQASAEESRDFARSALLSAWSLHPIENSRRVASQAARLYSLTYPRDWNWLLRNPKDLNPAVRAALVFYADVYALIFGTLLIAACLRIAFSLRPPPVLTALCIMLIGISVVMLLVFENKPFNIFPIWLVGALAIGFALSPRSENRSEQPAGTPRILHPGVSGLVAVLLLPATLLTILSATYSEASGRWLSDWTLTVSPDAPADDAWALALIDARPEAFDAGSYDPATLRQAYIANASGDGHRLQRRAGDAVTTMQFPAPVQNTGTLALSTVLCTNDSGRTRLEFFVFSPSGEELDNASYFLDVQVNGLASREVNLPLEGRNFQRFLVEDAFTENACHDLSFRMHARDAAPQGSDSQGPKIEIWMPRLVH